MAQQPLRSAAEGYLHLLRLSSSLSRTRAVPREPTRRTRATPPTRPSAQPQPPSSAQSTPTPAPQPIAAAQAAPKQPPIQQQPVPPPPPSPPPVQDVAPAPSPAAAAAAAAPTPDTVPTPAPEPPEPLLTDLKAPLEPVAAPAAASPASDATTAAPSEYRGVISKVPSSRFGRLMHYGGLAASLGWGMASEAVFRKPDAPATADPGATDAAPKRRSLLMSEANLEKLVSKLGKMRGAALKLGQFMSIQDTKQLPPQIEAILQRVQMSANFMPEWQTESVLRDTLGADWRDHFAEFDMRPFAAASIGQVHRATLSPSSPLAASYPHLTDLAVKVQFPGVRESITSDLGTLRWLLLASAALPRGLYLDNTLRVMGRELEDECDYAREAECGRRMRELVRESKELRGAFDVPQVVSELSGGMVLTTEMMHGRPLKDVLSLDQGARNWIGKRILQLCMHELFEFRLMQTDPNWSNFLYNHETEKLELIDFGATREYTPEFMDIYGKLLDAAIEEDRDAAAQYSSELGYFTGQETETMVNAHLDSLFALATPFRPSSPSPFPFGTLGPPITAKIREQIPVMLRERLTPPPEETYSLNRKLSGAFLLCERLHSEVPVQEMYARARGR
ncbi:hypothetical protein JCM8202_006226 [Rhodotorula sphaerocarpa]